MAEGSTAPEQVLPPQSAEVQKQLNTGRWDFLKKFNLFKKSESKVDGPIPGVIPASPEQLANPKVSLPEEQADINKQEINSADKAA